MKRILPLLCMLFLFAPVVHAQGYYDCDGITQKTEREPMKPKASVVAQKLINLYRQAHVIIGGWAAVNPIFIDEATPDVLDAMSVLPTGRFLVQHIA